MEYALLGNGSVNTFLWKRYPDYRWATAHKNNRRIDGRGVSYCVSSEAIYPEPQAS
jgi:hypothetical protein